MYGTTDGQILGADTIGLTGRGCRKKSKKGLGMERERPKRIDETNRRIDEREIDGWSREID